MESDNGDDDKRQKSEHSDSSIGKDDEKNRLFVYLW